jgi:TonB family protein
VHEQETACDDAVLDSGFEPARYAEALLEVTRHTTSNLLSGCSMKNQSNLKTRIARLLNTNVARKTTGTTARSIGIAFAALLLAIGMVSFVRPGRAEPAQSGEPYQVGGEVNAPRILSKVEPAYTDEARDAKIEGTVVLTVVIDSDGTAHDFTLVKSVDPGLDQNAIDAVRQWEFAPATLHGEPVAVRATIEINFRLQ